MPNGLVRGYTRHLMPVSPGAARTDPLDRGLVGEWRFDPATGLTLPDHSGTGGHGTIDGAVWTTSRYGPALDFSSDTVTIPDQAPFDITGAITLEAFVKPDSWPNYAGIIAKSLGSATVISNFQYTLFTNATAGQFRVAFDAAAWSFTTSGRAVGNWYHVIATADGTTWRGYVNGVADGSSVDATLPVSKARGPILGRLSLDTNDYYWDGAMALVRIYNRALTAAEVQSRYEICLKRAQPMTHVWMMPWGKVSVPPPTIIPIAMHHYRSMRL